MSVSLGTDHNGRTVVSAGSISVRADDEALARRMAGWALDRSRER